MLLKSPSIWGVLAPAHYPLAPQMLTWAGHPAVGAEEKVACSLPVSETSQKGNGGAELVTPLSLSPQDLR